MHYCIPCLSYRHGGRSKTCDCDCHPHNQPEPIISEVRRFAFELMHAARKAAANWCKMFGVTWVEFQWKRGKGTGTLRRERLSAITADWPVCEHKCPYHGRWKHAALPNSACHFPLFHLCPECLEVPTGYAKPLMRLTD